MPEDASENVMGHSTPRDQFEAFCATAPAFVILTDARDVILETSASLAAALGTDRDSLRRADARGLVAADGAVEGGGGTFTARLKRTNGATLPVRFSGTTLADGSGRRLYVLHDISDLVEAQSALQTKAQEAEEASRAKSRFLAAMSHEIRTPMNAILGFAQLLRLSDLDPKRREHVDAIMSAGGTLMNLLTDLLDLSQVEAGHMRLDTRAFDLRDMLDQVADWWHSTAREKGLCLNLALDSGLPERVVSDPVRLQQVLNNLLSNAMRYTSEGRIVLSVEERQRQDGLSRLRFEVADSGIGMTEDQLRLLFKPFVQIESDSAKDRGGWGLGLSICRNIADLMGGEIGVISEPGVGSTFHFEVPVGVAAAREASAVRVAPRPQAAGPVLRVLIAEDNTLNQDVMRGMLRELGHEVITVANGFEAIEALIKNEFDMVFMDITMPGLDGLGATRQIRQSDGAMGTVPIIACSAHVGGDVKERYRRAGIDDFLAKPFDRATLQSVIQRVTERRRDG